MKIKIDLTICTVFILGRCQSDNYSLLIEEIFSRMFFGRAAKFDYIRVLLCITLSESPTAMNACGGEFIN